ncbi:alpha-N-acetylgalactosaminide alpha-2,6-sialyltransferase 2 [Scophthalmus maximus]|uniref:alpha-N-acetylgalactosaminide alpha-2,6-sialyltransferase 2 n=1 Tax=Scophthalmus maximus TaxID=52904 RepID=UPI001FA86A9E|nr:alpha-N-acetylgalactosaminide alpha-2,6-sialyltransferase 2 [Scophthalmus maximus]XP_035468050.2 alpha-N-acetylgalactosaminide alpha-2,6-sialyltransferase 2 [Scophthalmus maximus]XP_035468051.2 alpha-N-acetylgalactosaminide alpha-2,6-sialyltransferase 2 [Scophthalmus maximus]
MALQRRLVLAALTVGSLLCIYILCVNLEGPLSWSVIPLSPVPGTSSSSRDSEEPLDRKRHGASTFHPEISTGTAPHETTRAPPTPPAPQAPPTRQQGVPGVSGSRTSTRGPTQATGPTEPPFIGDTYMTEDIPPQTNCSDGVGTRVATTEFAGRFLKRVPVLQWANHVSPEQHRRLSNYPGAHGWGGLDYKTLEETLSVLNSSANRQLLDDWSERRNGSECIRCAVVGNGGILKDSRKGKEIDGHHYVFRTNGAVIEGFEQDVGSRTTHYTFSTNTLMNSMRSYAGVGYRGPPLSQETRYVFLPDHDRDYLLVKAAATHTAVGRGPERAKDPTRYFGEDVSAEKLKMYHPDFIRYLRNRFLRSNALKTRYKNIYRPSTGAVMLLAALHACDQVSAYGFMTPDYKNYSDHYYDSSYHAVGFFINHDLRMEMSLWQQLHQAGLMRLYMHQ